MKNFSQFCLLAILVCGLQFAAFAQVQPPRESQRQEIAQTVADTRIAIVYHRPNVKGRPIFGAGSQFLQPYGEVWRTGANENTVFETSEDIAVNGQKLPAGKYGLHTIPNQNEWIVIFNKVNDAWGSFSYDQKKDQLRVIAKPETASQTQETMAFEFETVAPTTTNLVLTWEKVRLPITLDVGDANTVNTRVVNKMRQNIQTSNAADAKTQAGARMMAVNYILDNKMKANYADAAKWVDDAMKSGETFGNLRAKARLAAANNDYKSAATYGDKAVSVGKAAKANPDAIAAFEKDVASWKAMR